MSNDVIICFGLLDEDACSNCNESRHLEQLQSKSYTYVAETPSFLVAICDTWS